MTTPTGPDGSSSHDRQSVFRAGLWLSASGLFPVVTTAALSVVIARVLGPEDLGEQSLIAYVGSLAFGLLVASLVDAGIRTLAAARGAGDLADADRLTRWIGAGLLLGSVVAASIVAMVGLLRPDALPWLLLAATMLVDARGWSKATDVIAHRGWGPVSARRLPAQLGGQLAGIAAVFLGWGIAGVFGAGLVASVLLLVSLVRLAGPRRRVPWGPFPKALLRMWGLFALAQAITQVVGARIEFIFLDVFSDTVEVAMYSVAFMVVTTVALIPASMVGAAMPGLAAMSGAGRLDDVRASVARGTRVVAVTALPITAAVASLGPSLVLLVYGSEFREAAEIVPLMSTILVVAPISSVSVAYWTGRGMLRAMLITSAVGGALDIVVALSLIPSFGAWGATVANVVGQVIAAGALGVVTWRECGRFPLAFGGWLRMAVLSAVSAAAAWFAVETIPGWVGLVVGAAVLSVVLAAGALAMRVLTPGDARWAASATPQRMRPMIERLTHASDRDG